jgi:hypothetical protein
VNPAQNPLAKQRRAISEFIGPGGQATDQPRRKPVASKGEMAAFMEFESETSGADRSRRAAAQIRCGFSELLLLETSRFHCERSVAWRCRDAMVFAIRQTPRNVGR